MFITENDNDRPIIKEWLNFVNKGSKPNIVRDDVLKSWERSREYNIDPYSGKSNLLLTKEEFNKKIELYNDMIILAEPYIDKIYDIIKNQGYIFFITDNEGNLLLVKGDKDTLDSFKREINFCEGVSWSESAVGTTAVSMVLYQGLPVPFMSEEKYCYELKKRACSAVPIKNIDGELIIILGVAACFPNPNIQIFGMLLSVQMSLENRLRMQNYKELCMISNCYKAVFNSVSEPIIIVNNKGIITDINNKAKDIIGKESNKMLDRSASEVFDFYPVIMNVLKTGREFTGEICDTKNLKRPISIKNSIPLFNDGKDIYGCINILNIEYANSNSTYDKSKQTKYTFESIAGISEEIAISKQLAKKAALTDYNVLITGESGTGKELFAQAIHNFSLRSEGPFIAINCGSIPSELIESEFFGYESGAFTGANKEGSKGKFELAKGGTIFLDEICEMPKNLQIRLLRVLQEKEITRVGGSKPISVDIRIISATNKNLTKEIKEGRFREDLFWRLNVIKINIPKLAERKNDIEILAKYFVKKYSCDFNKKFIIDKKTINILKSYEWPGNVRELENAIKRSLVFAEGNVILPQHLPEYIFSENTNIGLLNDTSIGEIQNNLILKTLDEYEGNVTKASKKLGISRNTIYNKLKKME
ncbi:MAG: sigma-54 interaction domain-containing protein [Sedimentibacter sp.]